jgi:DNA repair exonuclease SbcCD ATPase subunit
MTDAELEIRELRKDIEALASKMLELQSKCERQNKTLIELHTSSSALRRERDEALTLLAEERAKHALTLQAYDQQSADFAALRRERDEARRHLRYAAGEIAKLETHNAKKDAALRDALDYIEGHISGPAQRDGIVREGRAAQGKCYSAISPCAHQRKDPNSICDICKQAAAPAPSAGETVLRTQEATEDMIAAARGLIDRWFLSGHSLAICEVWSAMLAAAPTTGETND